eukprot:2992457-Prymnesium_polylepis.1
MCRSRADCAKPSTSCGTHEFPSCAPDAGACTDMVVNMVISPLTVMVNIVAACATFGTAPAGTMAFRAGVKAAQVANKLAKLGRAGRLLFKFGDSMAKAVAQIGKLKKWAKRADKASERVGLANDLHNSAWEMWNQFNDLKELMTTQDVLRVYAGSYVADEAAAKLPEGRNGAVYKALTLFFMAEMGYVQAKEQTQASAGMGEKASASD